MKHNEDTETAPGIVVGILNRVLVRVYGEVGVIEFYSGQNLLEVMAEVATGGCAVGDSDFALALPPRTLSGTAVLYPVTVYRLVGFWIQGRKFNRISIIWSQVRVA